MDDANQRNDKLRDQLKSANQRIMLLSQNHSDEISPNMEIQLKQALELNEQRSSQIDEAQSQMAQLQAKVANLESALVAKEQELMAADTRYKKCVEKAKEVIKTLDPRAVNGKIL